MMIEEPVQFGEGGRLFGILTLPDSGFRANPERPVFVFLSSGLLHRIGPRRLYVRLARRLAEQEFASLRVDLSGRGDSAPAAGGRETSPEHDFRQIEAFLESRLGSVPLVIGGLCSAADDAIRVAPESPHVVGMLLLDPVCEKDHWFRLRELVQKYTSPARYLVWMRRRLRADRSSENTPADHVDALSLRDFPDPQTVRQAFEAIRERNGNVLSVFTSYALEYLNVEGQFGRVLEVPGYGAFCVELFWPAASHSFTLESHRARLIDEVASWARRFE